MVHVFCIPVHATHVIAIPEQPMNAISLEYTDLSSAALIKIFQVADLLGITPKEAAKLYLAAKAKQAPQTERGAA